MEIRSAIPEDLHQILSVLEEARLPQEGQAPLLRSVVVHPDHRGRGIGGELVRRALGVGEGF